MEQSGNNYDISSLLVPDHDSHVNQGFLPSVPCYPQRSLSEKREWYWDNLVLRSGPIWNRSLFDDYRLPRLPPRHLPRPRYRRPVPTTNPLDTKLAETYVEAATDRLSNETLPFVEFAGPGPILNEELGVRHLIARHDCLWGKEHIDIARGNDKICTHRGPCIRPTEDLNDGVIERDGPGLKFTRAIRAGNTRQQTTAELPSGPIWHRLAPGAISKDTTPVIVRVKSGGDDWEAELQAFLRQIHQSIGNRSSLTRPLENDELLNWFLKKVVEVFNTDLPQAQRKKVIKRTLETVSITFKEEEDLDLPYCKKVFEAHLHEITLGLEDLSRENKRSTSKETTIPKSKSGQRNMKRQSLSL